MAALLTGYDALICLPKKVLQQLKKILNFHQIEHYNYSLLERGTVLSGSTNVFEKCATLVLRTQEQVVFGKMLWLRGTGVN
jgi:hypothetical protein